jgi:hypothetical protein
MKCVAAPWPQLSSKYPITRIVRAGPYKGQAPVMGYDEDRAHEGRMQLFEITVTGHSKESE